MPNNTFEERIKRGDVVNSYEQIIASGGTGVVIAPTTITTSRAEYTPATDWVVIHYVDGKEVPTNQKAPWYFHGRKAFSFSGREEKKTALASAQAWAAVQLGVTGEWKRNTHGDYVQADIQKRFPIKRK